MTPLSIVKAVLVYVAAWFVAWVAFFYLLPSHAKAPKQMEMILGNAMPGYMLAFNLGLILLLSTRLYRLRKESRKPRTMQR